MIIIRHYKEEKDKEGLKEVTESALEILRKTYRPTEQAITNKRSIIHL